MNNISRQLIIDKLSNLESLPYGYERIPDLKRDSELNKDPSKRDRKLSSWWRYLEVVNLFCGEDQGKVLDIGSGWGTTYRMLSELGFEMSAFDISNPSKIDEKHFQLCDLNQINELPYDDGSFSSVVCSEVIEHIERPHVLLSEINRILSTNGIFILTTPNILSLHSRISFLRISMHGKFIWIRNDKAEYAPKHGEGGHITPMDYYQLNWKLRRLGFEIEELKTNVFDIPSGVKSIPFKVLNMLIKTRKGKNYNKNLELGESLIIKARKS